MRPNIFVYKNLKNEDYFTNSLGYLLNLFPRELGDIFISKLATSIRRPADYYGKFQRAEFTGFHFQNEASTSKPDLLIYTDKLKLFFEIKLNAPLSTSQLERHLTDVKREKGRLILIANKRTKISKSVLKSKEYLKPIKDDHFYWTDFEPIFYFRFRKNSFIYKIVKDFQQSLVVNYIRARQILGAGDNLYTLGSRSETLVLNKLTGLLKEIGFKVWRLPQEHTIRVYPIKMKEDPLLNPFFSPSGGAERLEECLKVYCYVKKNEYNKIKQIQKLVLLENSFPNIILYHRVYKEYYNVIIHIPIEFINVKKYVDLNWNQLRKVWKEIFTILEE